MEKLKVGETLRLSCGWGGYYLLGPDICEHNGKGVALDISEVKQMLQKEQIEELIKKANIDMESSKKMFGKEIFQKRFKPVFEGYLTALGSVLEMDDEEKTELIRGN